MAYSEEALAQLNEKFYMLNANHLDMLDKLFPLAQTLNNEKAKEYLLQGVCRRLKTLIHCIKNIFSLFPPDIDERIDSEDLKNVEINLHAFFINISGILDNLAWVYACEKNLQLNRFEIGLFKESTLQHFPEQLKNHLTGERIKVWHEEYTKNYRDALAHRIPLYVPPFTLNDEEAEEYKELEQQKSSISLSDDLDIEQYQHLSEQQDHLGSNCYLFAQSLEENGRPVYFHAQVLADFATVEAIIEEFHKSFE